MLLDTAGRTHIDEPLMAEMAEIRDAARPHEILLVADSLTGQDAVNLAKNFNERVGVTGIVLTRVDGDGRGGAALSMRAVTGKPIKLLGVGEKMDALEDFHPRRLADRILGMGDIVSLVEKAAETIDMAQAAKMAEKMRKGIFDLNDMSEQLAQIEKLGGMGGIMGMLPGMAKMKDQLARGQSRRDSNQAPARDHRLDDGQGAAQSAYADRRPPQGLAQEAHRRRRRRQGRGGQQADQAASPDGRHDEGDGRRKGQARHDGPARPDDGHGRRNAATDAGADRSLAKADGWGRGRGISHRAARPAGRAAPRRLQPAAAISRPRRRPARGCPASVASTRSPERRNSRSVQPLEIRDQPKEMQCP